MQRSDRRQWETAPRLVIRLRGSAVRIREAVLESPRHSAKACQNSLACSGDRSDECDHRRQTLRTKEKRMSTFTIDADNNITAYASAEEATQGDSEGLTRFDSQAALAKVSADWPISRFVEIWNGIPGQSPVKKFQDRKKAVARVWAAIQPLAANGASEKPKVAKPEPSRKSTKPANKVKAAKKAPKPTGDKATDRSNKTNETID